MNSKPIKPQPFYSDSFKLGVVRRVANGLIFFIELRFFVFMASPCSLWTINIFQG